MTVRRLSTRSAGFADALASLLAFESAQDPAVDTAVAGIVEDVKQRGDLWTVPLVIRGKKADIHYTVTVDCDAGKATYQK